MTKAATKKRNASSQAKTDKKFTKKITKRQPKKLPGEMSMEELDASVKEICNKFVARDDVRKKALADAGKPFFLPPDELRAWSSICCLYVGVFAENPSAGRVDGHLVAS